MKHGSRARFVHDSLPYMRRVRQLNSMQFLEIRDQLMSELINALKIISQIHDPVRIIQNGDTEYNVSRGMSIVDLSGKSLPTRFKLMILHTSSSSDEMVFKAMVKQEIIEELKAGNINATTFKYIPFLSKALAVECDSKENPGVTNFAFIIDSSGIFAIKETLEFLFRLPNHMQILKDQLKTDISHELIHIIDPRRRRGNRTYDISNGRVYTDHETERASKSNDAFEELILRMNHAIENGNIQMIIDEKNKFSRDKTMYVDYYIKENVSTDWGTPSAYGRQRYAPMLYRYCISALDNYFEKANWGNIIKIMNNVQPQLRKMFNDDMNAYFMQKHQFHQNPGSYIWTLLQGNGVIKMRGSLPQAYMQNEQVFELCRKYIQTAFDSIA